MRLRRKLAITGVLATLMVVLGTGVASAAGPAPVYQGPAVSPSDIGVSLNMLWIVIGAVLVIFMQAGFAMVETGFCRAKAAAHVCSTNFMIFGLGIVGFFLVGYAFMFGGFSVAPGVGNFGYDKAIGGPLIGSGHWVFLWHGGFAMSNLHNLKNLAPVAAFFLYMVAFMDTTATIPTGAMAERWKWKSFVGWGLFCGAIYYPLFGAWTWGGGWLSQLGNSFHWGFGYVDFAGSGVVHAMGGVAGLAGILVLGPRIGKYGPDGKPRTLAAHNIPMALLGTFILLFGWFGFNAASTFAATDVRFAVVALNTAIAAGFGAVTAMFWAYRRFGKPDPGMMANGMLAGLVAITAPCAFVNPAGAAIIGSIAGIIVVISIIFLESHGIDDPVGAVSVHGVCGIWGVLSVGLFSTGEYGAGFNTTIHGAAAKAPGVTGLIWGIFDGHEKLGAGQLASQAAGALVICTVMLGVAYTFFKIQAKFLSGSIRAEEAHELEGVDRPEMGVLAYDNLVVNELDIVGMEGEPEVVMSGGRSPDPTVGR